MRRGLRVGRKRRRKRRRPALDDVCRNAMFPYLIKSMDIAPKDLSFRAALPGAGLGDIRMHGRGEPLPIDKSQMWIVWPIANPDGVLRRDATNQRLLAELQRNQMLTIQGTRIWVLHDGRNRVHESKRGARFAEAVAAMPTTAGAVPRCFANDARQHVAWGISAEGFTEWRTPMGEDDWRRHASGPVSWEPHVRRPCPQRSWCFSADGRCMNSAGPRGAQGNRRLHAWKIAHRGFLSLLGCDECESDNTAGLEPAWPESLHFLPTPSRLAFERMAPDEDWDLFPYADDLSRAEAPVCAWDPVKDVDEEGPAWP